MIKEDEKILYREIKKRTGSPYEPYIKDRPLEYETPREVGESLGMNPKRVQFLLEKWNDKGYMECGVNEGNGWMTPEGIEVEL